MEINNGERNGDIMTLKDIPEKYISLPRENVLVVSVEDIKADIIKTCKEFEGLMHTKEVIGDKELFLTAFSMKRGLMEWAGITEEDL